MRGFDAQLASRQAVLKTIIESAPVNWRDIISETAQQTGSAKISQSALDWLLASGYIKRVSRGVYEATERGVKFLKAVSGVSA